MRDRDSWAAQIRSHSLSPWINANCSIGGRVAEVAEQGQAGRPAKKGLPNTGQLVRARSGAPLEKGNSHGIEISAIDHARVSGVMRSAHSNDAKTWTVPLAPNSRKLRSKAIGKAVG